MSMKWTALAMDHGPVIRSYKLVLLALCDRADEKGLCWPSREDLRDRACMSDATLTRALRWLEREGWLQRQRRFNTSNLFRLNVWRLMELEVAKRALPAATEGFEPFPEELAARKDAPQPIENKGSAHGEQGSAHGEQGSAHFAATNLSKTNQKPKGAAAPRDPLEFRVYLAEARAGQSFDDWKAARLASH